MQTDFPTVEIYFAFAFTYCKLRVYKLQESFIRKVLTARKVEFLKKEDSQGWQEVDTRLLLDMVSEALPKLLEDAGLTGSLLAGIKKSLDIKSMDME